MKSSGIQHKYLQPCVAEYPSLKINIPKDSSKPDGDAVENGALLSMSELHMHGHFVNSPSDTAPIPKAIEAMPSERQEGEERGNDELSAQEVLLNPLLWWKVSTLFIYLYPFLIICIQIHASKFPTIAQMAQDYLAIPATSVSVE